MKNPDARINFKREVESIIENTPGFSIQIHRMSDNQIDLIADILLEIILQKHRIFS